MMWIYDFIPNVTSHPKWLWCFSLSKDSDLMDLEGIPGSCLTTGLRQFCSGSLLSKVKTADSPDKAHTPEQDIPGAPWSVWCLPPFSTLFSCYPNSQPALIFGNALHSVEKKKISFTRLCSVPRSCKVNKRQINRRKGKQFLLIFTCLGVHRKEMKQSG